MLDRANGNLLTITEVSELLHVHPNTLRRWSEEGRIVSYRINSRGDRRFKPGDVQDFLKKFNPYQDEILSGERADE
jgi:excisionase family DNA binding protein